MVSDYISKQKACEVLDDLAAYYDHKIHQPIISNGIEIARTKLSNMSTTDAEPIVHCCDCIYHEDAPMDSEGNIQCLYCKRKNNLQFIVDFTDFCSYGEKNERD